MKEIKFRAWDINLKHMVYSDQCYFVFKGGKLIERDGAAYDCMNYDNDVIMQFTGLKDKNDKEIYEGDILSWDKSIIGVVNFAHAEYIAGEGINARALCNMPDSEVEIIGNVYKNPELLK